MSIRWIKNVMVDGRPATLEVLLGSAKIADKCYIRINKDEELWFYPTSDNREAILEQGLDLLKNRFQGRNVMDTNGSAFTWH